jgi:hypothetical protein
MHSLSLVQERRIHLQAFRLQSYEHTDEHGTTRAWNVTQGIKIASDGRKPIPLNLKRLGLTTGKIETLYEGIDKEYAMTTALSEPLLVVPFFDAILIIDGWHRMWKAAHLKISELPALHLTVEEAKAIQWLECPALQSS